MEEWVEGERNGTSMEEIHASVGKMVEDMMVETLDLISFIIEQFPNYVLDFLKKN